MGRAAGSETTGRTRLGAAEGSHERQSYIQLMVGLRILQVSGIVTIQFRRRSRTILVLGGHPVAYRSDLPEDSIEKTLVASNLVPADRLKWMMDRLSADENLTEALVMSGALSHDDLAQHRVHRMKIGLGAALSWASGTWSFEPRPSLQSEQIDPDLIPRSDILPSLWHGVKQFVSMEDILSQVSDPSLGKMLPSEGLSEALALLDLDETQSKLDEAVGTGCSMDDLFTRIPDTTGTLVRLVWFLAQAEVLCWENAASGAAVAMLRSAESEAPRDSSPSSAQATRERRSSSAQRTPPPAERTRAKRTRPTSPLSGRGQRDISKVIANDYRRIDRDFYAFLGVNDDASDDQIRLQCKRVAKRWRTAQANPALNAEGRDQVKDLLAGASMVWQMLKETKNRAQYDERKKNGRAPTVRGALPTTIADRNMGAPLEAPAEAEEAPEASSTGGSSAGDSRARALVDEGQFTAAIPLLQRARMDNPSDADTLADLGWAIYKTLGGGHPDDEDSPDDFVRLALTFEPRNERALEYWARMAIEGGDSDEARRRLKGLVKMHPETGWARMLLESEAALEQEIQSVMRTKRKG
jgi:tetratricopeptide (TPR) repeat protein